MFTVLDLKGRLNRSLVLCTPSLALLRPLPLHDIPNTLLTPLPVIPFIYEVMDPQIQIKSELCSFFAKLYCH